MKIFTGSLVFALIVASQAFAADQTVTREWTQARNLYDWMQSMRARINNAGLDDRPDELRKLRGLVMVKMGDVKYGKDKDPYQFCGLALHDMQVFLTAAIDKKPKKDRDTMAAVFRNDLNECKRSLKGM